MHATYPTLHTVSLSADVNNCCMDFMQAALLHASMCYTVWDYNGGIQWNHSLMQGCEQANITGPHNKSPLPLSVTWEPLLRHMVTRWKTFKHPKQLLDYWPIWR
jgi:hypothetical protein